MDNAMEGDVSRRLREPQRTEARAAIADLREIDKWLRAIRAVGDDGFEDQFWAGVERDPEGFMADVVTWWNVLIAALRDSPSAALDLYAGVRRSVTGQDDLPQDQKQRRWLAQELLRFFEQVHQRVIEAELCPDRPAIERARALRKELVEFNRAWYSDVVAEWLRGFHDDRVQAQFLAEGTKKIELENLPREDVPGAAAIAWAEREPGESIGETINRFEREMRKSRPAGHTIERHQPGGKRTRRFVRDEPLDKLTETDSVQTIGGLAYSPVEEWVEEKGAQSDREDELAKLRELPLRGRLQRIRDLIVDEPKRFVDEHNRIDCVELASAVGGTPKQVSVEVARLRRMIEKRTSD